MNDFLEEKQALLSSFLLFTKTFFKLRTGREFKMSYPVCRESHQIIIARELTKVFNLETKRLLINIPPGHAKSTFLKYFIAWAMAWYPDCQFLYISYSHELAAKHTADIKKIMELTHYRKLFGIEISRDSSAKDDFKTLQGGAVKAFGSSGGITGQDAGLPNLDRFSGCVLMDDMHKPDEAHSETRLENVKNNYIETISPRPRGPNVAQISIGQRLREGDLPDCFIHKFDGHEWKKIILKAVDDAGNVLAPDLLSKEDLTIMKDVQPYKYASQYQQDPIPAGGGIFKPEWFILLDEEPDILATFITADTAETSKTHNDPTVFSFWGLYKILNDGIDTGLMGLHWLDCLEAWLEPKDLHSTFMQFWADCMRHKVKPQTAAIEKKSTGTTLASVLGDIQGIGVIEVERTRESGSKTARFLQMQPYAASKQISLPAYGKHTKACVDHMKKITANETHRRDDRADTCYDGVKLGLIDKSIYYETPHSAKAQRVADEISGNFKLIQQQRTKKWQM